MAERVPFRTLLSQALVAFAIESDPSASRTKLARLTLKGLETRNAYRELLAKVENRWKRRYESNTIEALRKFLEPIVGDGTADSSPLFRGLEPDSEAWRARLPRSQTLPHFPMVLHRGGYPDGI